MPGTDADLQARLARLQVEHDEVAVERSVTAARSTHSGERRRRRGLIAGGLLVAIAALVVSPAGGALAGAFGDLVGIGESPSRTDELDPEAAFPPSRDQRVIATGTAPNGLDYEVIATASRYDIPLGVGERFGMCVDIDLPAAADSYKRRDYWPLSCVNNDVRRATREGGTILEVRSAQPELGPETALVASGWVPLEVEAVDVSFEDQSGRLRQLPVAFGRVEGEVAAEIKAKHELGFFTAFVPPEVLGSQAGADDMLDRCEAQEALGRIEAKLEYTSGRARAFRPPERYAVPIVMAPPKAFERPLGRDGSARDAMRPGECR